ncbi:hypothetical protein GA0074696_4853 [Micromonospora purpureochromogenes]|uniref:Uncharacterized protein n=1 Tax=Micromonospora purpureochromogenes TaxID=47872 RepID=A0A1C4ZT79_9ACTN|nr:hypothetical protein GA0074696_4853 [Micromonospora purpureochromogenes]
MSVHTGSITRRGHLRKRCLAPRRDGGRWADRPARPVVLVENLGVVRVVPDAGGRAGRPHPRDRLTSEKRLEARSGARTSARACVSRHGEPPARGTDGDALQSRCARSADVRMPCGRQSRQAARSNKVTAGRTGWAQCRRRRPAGRGGAAECRSVPLGAVLRRSVPPGCSQPAPQSRAARPAATDRLAHPLVAQDPRPCGRRTGVTGPLYCDAGARHPAAPDPGGIDVGEPIAPHTLREPVRIANQRSYLRIKSAISGARGSVRADTLHRAEGRGPKDRHSRAARGSRPPRAPAPALPSKRQPPTFQRIRFAAYAVRRTGFTPAATASPRASNASTAAITA